MMLRLRNLLRITVACIAVAGAYVAICYRIEFEQQRREYSKIIEAISEASLLMHDNADVMARFTHYTDWHTKKHRYCLECNDRPLPETGWKYEPAASLLKDPTWVDTWDAHVLHDVVECRNGIRSFLMQLQIQHVKLRRTLDEMREAQK